MGDAYVEALPRREAYTVPLGEVILGRVNAQVVASLLIGGTTAAVTAVFGWLTALRAQYERVLSVIEHVSSDQVAEARDIWGAYIHSGRSQPRGDDERREIIRRLFVILWALNRIDAVRQTLPAYRWKPLVKLCGPHRLLVAGTRPWVEYCVAHVDEVSEQVGADIEGSDEGMRNLQRAWKITISRQFDESGNDSADVGGSR